MSDAWDRVLDLIRSGEVQPEQAVTLAKAAIRAAQDVVSGAEPTVLDSIVKHSPAALPVIEKVAGKIAPGLGFGIGAAATLIALTPRTPEDEARAMSLASRQVDL